jgi:hypothetical protein
MLSVRNQLSVIQSIHRSKLTQVATMNSISNRHSERSEESPLFGSIIAVGMLRFTQHDMFIANVANFILR